MKSRWLAVSLCVSLLAASHAASQGAPTVSPDAPTLWSLAITHHASDNIQDADRARLRTLNEHIASRPRPPSRTTLRAVSTWTNASFAPWLRARVEFANALCTDAMAATGERHEMLLRMCLAADVNIVEGIAAVPTPDEIASDADLREVYIGALCEARSRLGRRAVATIEQLLHAHDPVADRWGAKLGELETNVTRALAACPQAAPETAQNTQTEHAPRVQATPQLPEACRGHRLDIDALGQVCELSDVSGIAPTPLRSLRSEILMDVDHVRSGAELPFVLRMTNTTGAPLVVTLDVSVDPFAMSLLQPDGARVDERSSGDCSMVFGSLSGMRGLRVELDVGGFIEKRLVLRTRVRELRTRRGECVWRQGAALPPGRYVVNVVPPLPVNLAIDGVPAPVTRDITIEAAR